jgi:hypothetical protein
LLLADPSSAKQQTVDIEVLAQNFDGSAVGWLRARDFVATSDGGRLPVSVARPVLSDMTSNVGAVPTRVLVVVNSWGEESNEAFKALQKALCPVWRRGWTVAVARRDGRVAGYASSAAQLEQDWKAPDKPNTGRKNAVRDLGSFVGRRIVIVLAGNQKASTPVPDWLTRMSGEEMAEVFVVDGGRPDSSGEPVGSEIPGAYPAAEPAAQVSGLGRISSQDSEVNVHHAVRDAMRLARGYYDLRVTYPDTETITADAMLTVQIKGPSSFRVAAQVYGETGVPKLVVTRK